MEREDEEILYDEIDELEQLDQLRIELDAQIVEEESQVPTERELFLSTFQDRYQEILDEFSPQQLKNFYPNLLDTAEMGVSKFHPLTNLPELDQNKVQIKTDSEKVLDAIWRKNKRLDLVKWDIQDPNIFLDYESGELRSLDQVLSQIDNYPNISLERLSKQLEGLIVDPRTNFNQATQYRKSRFFELVGKIQNILS